MKTSITAALASVALLTGCGASEVTAPVTVTETAPAVTVTATAETVTATVTETILRTESVKPEAPEPVATDTDSSLDFVEPQSFSGTGHDVIDVTPITSLAVLTFDCDQCTDRLSIKTDNDDYLLFSKRGPYHGSNFVNLRMGDQISQIEVGADGPWTLKVDDFTTASQKLKGNGDTALLIGDESRKATIKYRGGGNFQVEVWSVDGSQSLVVNEIGNYDGTVLFNAPAAVQVTANGPWTIKLID